MNNQQEELSTVIRKVQKMELPAVDIVRLCKPCPSISWSEFSPLLHSSGCGSSDYCIVDVRSEGEFAKCAIPGSHNISLFDNEERHNIGLLFKQKSKVLAMRVGAYYAYKKMDLFLSQIKKVSAGRKIIVYCWRGGSRSKATTALLIRKGFDAVRLEGGHKVFRQQVHQLLYNTPLNLLSLSGKTGVGKSAILEFIQQNYPNIPLIHLEQAANHASSVFGPSRFAEPPVNSQQQFEARLYVQLTKFQQKDGSLPLILSEKESSKIGRVSIPNGILNGLREENHIRIKSPIQRRVKRIYNEYIEEADCKKLTQLRQQIEYLRRYLGQETLTEYLQLFDTKKWDTLLKKILLGYYDKVYRKSSKTPVATVEYEEVPDAVAVILNIYDTLTQP